MGEHFPVKEKLHTDVLEQKYGPIHSLVVRHDDRQESSTESDSIREAKLVDVNNIMRTYALTFLTYNKDDKEICKIDEQIRGGGLIGKTFREHGYIIKKNVIDVFLIDIPEWMKVDFQTEDTKAKARITEFYAKKENQEPLIYGEVLEIYSPDFRNPAYGINEIDEAQINPLTETLEQEGISGQEIWMKIDRAGESDNNEWNDVKEKYQKAKEASAPIIARLHSKIENYLKQKK